MRLGRNIRSKRALGKKVWLAIGAVVIVCALTVVILSADKPKEADAGYVTHLDPKGLSVTTKTGLVTTKDANKNNKIDGGDVVNFSFTVTNQNPQKAKSVSLDTGLAPNKVAFIQNIQGSTGVATNTPTYVFKNIVLQPHQTQTLSFDAQMLYSPDDLQLQISPKLTDPSESVVAKGKVSSVTVMKVDMQSIVSQVKQTKEGASE